MATEQPGDLALRLDQLDPFVVAGLETELPPQSPATIPALWERLNAWRREVGKSGVCYGVIDYAGNRYIAGIAVESGEVLPAEMVSVTVPAGAYAIAIHRGSVDGITATWDRVGEAFSGEFGLRYGFAPLGRVGFERYDERFQPGSADSITELYTPVVKR